MSDVKQVTQTQRGGTLATKEVPTPLLQAHGVVVQTAFSLISAGTERSKVEVAKKSLLGKALARPDQVRLALDMVRQAGLAATYHKVSARLSALSPLGYSSAGVVVYAGAHAGDLRPGDRVACAGAGYANHSEYVYVPRNLCARVPPEVSLDDAAYATVGAIALQGVRQAAVTLGEAVGVIGLGLLGLLTVQFLKASGCRVVGLDPDPLRRDLALGLGADAALGPSDATVEASARALSPAGLDAVILCAATSSSEPVRLAGQLCRERARVVVVGAVGLEVPRSPFYEKELDVRMSRSYGPGRYDPGYEERGCDYPIGYVRWTEGRNLDAFLDLLAQKRVSVSSLTTHRFGIEEAERAYELLENKRGEPYLGILLQYGEAATESPAVTQGIAVAPARTAVPGQLGLGLLGAGSFAQSMLLPHLSQDKRVQLRAVATSSGLTARSVAERAGFERCASDSEDVINDAGVGLIVIATRHDSHAPLACRALAAGKAVFVEKPLALDDEQLESVVEAWRGAQHPFLMVGFNRRFAPLVVSLKSFLAASPEPMALHYRVNAGHVPPAHWVQDPETGGGRIIGEVCHFVDLLAHLSGSQPREVYGMALPDGGRYCRDNVAVTLRFDNGSVGTITYVANGDRAVPKERIEVFTGGRAGILEDFRTLTLAEGGRQRRESSGQDKGHAAEMRLLVEAVRGGSASPVPFPEAVAATRATLAVLQSLATGQPISLPAVS